MSLTAIFYLSVLFLCLLLALLKGPFWGLITYLLVYFISPAPEIHWWGRQIPQFRWSLIVSFVFLSSSILHKEKNNSLDVLRSESLICLLLFWALSIIISFFAIDTTASFARCYRFFCYLIVVFLTSKSIASVNNFKTILFVLLILGALLGLEAMGGHRVAGRLEGIGPPDSNDANNFALLLSSLAPLGIALFLDGGKLTKCIVTVCEAFILNGIILANSRGAVLSLIVCVCSIGLFISSGKDRFRLLAIIGIGAIAFLYLTDDIFIERFATTSSSINEDRGSGRMDIWAYGMQMIPDYPLGTGGDGFRRLSPEYIPDNLLTHTDFGVERVPHNTYLLITVEQGVLGLILFLSYFYFLFRNLFRAKATSSEQFIRLTAAVFIGILFGHLFGIFFGDRLYYEFIYIIGSLTSILYYFSTIEDE